MERTVSMLWLKTSGCAFITVSRARLSSLKSGVKISTFASQIFLISSIQFLKCCAPPSGKSSRVTEVITANLSPSSLTASATCLGSSKSSGSGRAGEILQYLQFLVQTFPIIKKVAVL